MNQLQATCQRHIMTHIYIYIHDHVCFSFKKFVEPDVLGPFFGSRNFMIGKFISCKFENLSFVRVSLP